MPPHPSLYGALAAIGCAAAVFLGGAVLFARGYLGGGDVKLLAAATLWAGPAGTPTLLMLTGVLGGALALFLLMPFGRQIAAAARSLLGSRWPTPSAAWRCRYPMASRSPAPPSSSPFLLISVEPAMRVRTLILLLLAVMLAGGTASSPAPGLRHKKPRRN